MCHSSLPHCDKMLERNKSTRGSISSTRRKEGKEGKRDLEGSKSGIPSEVPTRRVSVCGRTCYTQQPD
ncbi:hypothetical protein LEMLEM_LOCUS18630 [Lemmus lemmus]